MKVYLIRHTQSEENILSLTQKTTIRDFNAMLSESPHTPLTRWGKFQAQVMAGQLEGTHIEKIYSSPYDRALETATIIGNEFHLTPHIVYDLREVLPQQLNALRKKKNRATLGKLLIHSYARMALPGGAGEKLPASLWRARRVWKRLTHGPAREIAIVSHYGLISLILLHIRSTREWRIVSRNLANGGMSVIVKR